VISAAIALDAAVITAHDRMIFNLTVLLLGVRTVRTIGEACDGSVTERYEP
jgi:hypothetical protein